MANVSYPTGCGIVNINVACIWTVAALQKQSLDEAGSITQTQNALKQEIINVLCKYRDIGLTANKITVDYLTTIFYDDVDAITGADYEHSSDWGQWGNFTHIENFTGNFFPVPENEGKIIEDGPGMTFYLIVIGVLVALILLVIVGLFVVRRMVKRQRSSSYSIGKQAKSPESPHVEPDQVVDANDDPSLVDSSAMTSYQGLGRKISEDQHAYASVNQVYTPKKPLLTFPVDLQFDSYSTHSEVMDAAQQIMGSRDGIALANGSQEFDSEGHVYANEDPAERTDYYNIPDHTRVPYVNSVRGRTLPEPYDDYDRVPPSRPRKSKPAPQPSPTPAAKIKSRNDIMNQVIPKVDDEKAKTAKHNYLNLIE